MRMFKMMLSCFVIIITVTGYAVNEEASNTSNKNNESEMQMVSKAESDQIQDFAVKQIVQSIEKKLANVKGYTADIERQILSPNGGFDKFIGEDKVRCPDRILVKAKMTVAHNKEDVGKSLTIMINENSLYTCFDRSENRSNFNGTGAPPRRDYIAKLGYLVDPFGQYKMETLKLDKETETEWVLVAEYKYPNAWKNRLTIDKTTGLLKKVEALIKELGNSVVLLDVKRVSLSTDDMPDSLFKIEGEK